MGPMIKTGAPAPNFTLTDLKGERHTLIDYRDKIVVLMFWSAECPWSAKADRALDRMQAEWEEDIVTLAVASNANESREEIKEAARERGVETVLLDPGAETAKAYGATITPEVFVIDRDGRLRYQGAFNDATFRQPEPTCNYLWQALEALLADENPVPGEVPAYGCTIVMPSA
jgi:peroxiredoxin